MSTKRYRVYILASKSRALYVGITAFLMSHVLSHREGESSKFTSKYRVHRLVYYETFQDVETAIRRETEIKEWRREKKIALINKKNPAWEDLAQGGGERAEMTYKPVPRTSQTAD